MKHRVSPRIRADVHQSWVCLLHLSFTLALAAVLIEAVAGYPAPLYRVIGHPVTWIGWLIARLDRGLNREGDRFALRRGAGVLALAILLGVAGGAGAGLSALFSGPLWGFAVLALLASSLLAQRSLYEHVRAVAVALTTQGLEAGRREVAMIVGRNTAVLDEAGVARAAIESLAENFSDGIVAPVFWTALGGLTGGVLYKAVNTADSMIGHRNARHAAFGWAAARLDDLVNLPASRLSALWIVLAAVPDGTAGAAAQAVWRDAGKHRSPNAGWPEAAMAGALGLQLAGPRVYGETLVDDVFMGSGRRDANAADIFAGLSVYRRACVVQGLVLSALAFLGPRVFNAL